MNASIPIIVALEIENININTQLIFDLNRLCNVEKGINFKFHIPHLTLWMGFIEKKELQSLIFSLNKVFSNINIDVFVNKSDLFVGIEGNVLSLQVEKTRNIELLQNRVHHFFEPYRKISKPNQKFNASTIKYVNSFSKKSLENFDPHITIGFTDQNYTIAPFTLNLRNPKIFLMGNNCTCLEVISS